MFNKNDPLIGSVKAVMQMNELRRQVEANLCEEIGIYSRQALPREYHANYDALLEQRMKEELVGNQQKLDVHEPEKDKLTAQDFKMLRAKKTMKEEEQLDELSSKTYKSAMMKAVQRHTNASTLMQKDKKEKAYAQAKKFQKAGIAKEKQEKTMEEEDTKTSDPDMAAPTNPSQRGASNGQEIKARVPTNAPMPPPRPKNIKEEELDEAAKSKAQQRLFGAALAARRGESEPGSRKVAKLAADVSSKELKKFAKTKHKGLPEKVDEDFDLDAVMEEIRANLGEEAFNALMAEAVPARPTVKSSVSMQPSSTPITARKGEGATGKALADFGISREQRRSQEFVTKTLGTNPATGKPYVQGSAASNLALKAKMSQQAGDRTGSDEPVGVAARPTAAPTASAPAAAPTARSTGATPRQAPAAPASTASAPAAAPTGGTTRSVNVSASAVQPPAALGNEVPKFSVRDEGPTSSNAPTRSNADKAYADLVRGSRRSDAVDESVKLSLSDSIRKVLKG